MKIKPINVTMLNQYVKKYFKSNSIFYNLLVEGEVSNICLSKTGYTYFTLLDNKSSVNCICFNYVGNIINGDRVIVNGELSVYESKGIYQIVVKSIDKVGLGSIFKDLEQLKQKLKKEGLFENKKNIKSMPDKIGIITSKRGDALKDILKTFNNVKGSFEVLVYDSLMQGEYAENNILKGIEYFNNFEKVDVIILSRGGGSFEDLNIFNNLKIAESIFRSKVPLVTGIGHEADVTLADYVADVHCHTPTAAAEYVTKGFNNIYAVIQSLYKDLVYNTNNKLDYYKNKLIENKSVLKNNEPFNVIEKLDLRLKSDMNILHYKTDFYLNNKIKELEYLNKKLSYYNYSDVLKKGYSLVIKDNMLLNSKNNVNVDDIIYVLCRDFKIKTKILDIEVENER